VFDWYLEMAKPLLAGETDGSTHQTLGVVARDLLRLFHPAIPYVTEELWSHLVGDGLLAGASWPDVPAYPEPAGMDDVQEMIAGVRRFRADQGLAARRRLPLALLGPDLGPWALELIGTLATVSIEVVDSERADGHTRIVAGDMQGFIPLEGVVDVEAERARLDRAIAQAEADLGRVAAKLDNPSFIERAPADVVEKERRKHREMSALLETLSSQRAVL